MTIPDLRALVEAAMPDELPALAGRLREAELLAEVRLRAEEGPAKAAANLPGPEKWISAEVAAGIASVSVKRIYEWAVAKKWAARPTRRCLRIEESGFRRWLKMR